MGGQPLSVRRAIKRVTFAPSGQRKQEQHRKGAPRRTIGRVSFAPPGRRGLRQVITRDAPSTESLLHAARTTQTGGGAPQRA